ncbi:PAS domain S-box protein, partial [Amaricoccus sp.]|uniref:PAS domain S-box protein n=1 Tax=Amaricoccus sp. TaxID=1872485 RepID=UPI001B5E25A4
MTAEDDGAAVAKRAAARPAVIATALLATFAAGMGLRYAAETGAALPYAAVLAATAAAAGAALWLNARDLARMRRVEFRLRAAIDALPDGLAVYDAAERIVLWNARYPEHLTPSMRPHLAAGRRFEDILRAGIASGPVYHPDMGPDFPEKRLAMRALDRSDHAQRLADGRWLRIRESRTPDGGRVLLTQDVTQERRRDGELRLLATAIEQVGEPVEITDAAHVFTYVNHAFETLTGWRSEEAIGRQPQDVLASGVHPPEFFADMLARLEGGGTWQGTIVNRHRDGRLIEQDTTISPLRGPDGVISHYVAVKRDVTATRAQARALAESEARYRAVVDAQTELIIRVDPKGRWTFMNPASVRYWGMTAEETNALGISDADTIHPSDRAAFREHLARITPDNPTHAIEVRSVQMNGEVHWEAWTDTGIFDAGGNLLEVQCVGRVIDDRKRAEADRDSAERLRQAALEAALDCYVGIDATGVIVEFNAAAERTFGYARGEVLGQRMADLIIPPHLRAAHLAGFERHLATGEARLLGRRVELEAMRADGATFPIELVIVRADRDGGPLFLAYLRDLTARRAAEDALAASEARFRQIAEGVPVGVIISEIGTGRPLFLNATARRQLGLGQEDPAPETMLATWVDAGDRDRLLAEVARAGADSGFEAELHAEGGRITAHLSATRIDYGGRPALMTAAID